MVASVFKVGDDNTWTEPVIHSKGNSHGDVTDLGDAAVEMWMTKFTEIYTEVLHISKFDLWNLDSRTFVHSLDTLGCFEVDDQPFPSDQPPPHLFPRTRALHAAPCTHTCTSSDLTTPFAPARRQPSVAHCSSLRRCCQHQLSGAPRESPHPT